LIQSILFLASYGFSPLFDFPMSAQGLPAHILALFTPRPPPQHLPVPVAKRVVNISGCADFVEFFGAEKPPKREAWESPKERSARRHREKLKEHKDSLQKLIDSYDPHKDADSSGDPFRTLFVARISYDTTEKKLKREFEVFGSIKKVRMVYDHKGKPRGYAFVEYEHERDLKNAYKQGDGKKIDGRRVMVDVERGRTVDGWLPRRLGGGRGPGREGKPSKKKRKQIGDAPQERESRKEEKPRMEAIKDTPRRPDEEKEERPKEKREEKDRARDKEPKERRADKDREKGREKGKERDKDKDKAKEKDRGSKRKREDE